MKLPILSVAKEAYAFVWHRKGAFWALAVPGVAVLALFYALFAWMIWFKAGKPEKLADYVFPGETGFDAADPLFLAVWAASVIAYVAILVMYSVAWHRLYLLPGASSSPALAYRWHGRQTRFLLNYVKLFVIGFILWFIAWFLLFNVTTAMDAFAGPTVGHGGFLFILIVVVGLALAIGYTLARFSMIFPATAADAHMTVREGWRFARGNGWRMLWIIVVVGLPIGIVGWFVDLAARVLGVATGAVTTLTGNLALALVQQFVAFVGLAVGVTALSASYARLRQARQSSPSSSPQGPPLPGDG